MTKLRIFSLYLILCFLALIIFTAGNIGAQSVDLDRLVPEFEISIKQMMLEGKVPSCAIALVSGDGILWTGAYGYSNQ